ncbi:hypothetical protein ACTXT7_000404 [Hymenolepis weldensis]
MLPYKLCDAGPSTELLCPPEYHITLKQIIQYIYKDNAPAGNTQTQNFITIGQQPVKHQPQFFTFFAAVMEVGEMKSAVVKRPPQKFTVPELMNPGLNTSADEGKNNQRLLHKCEITLIDETCGHFPMILWNEDLIMYALRFWKSKKWAHKVASLSGMERFQTLMQQLHVGEYKVSEIYRRINDNNIDFSFFQQMFPYRLSPVIQQMVAFICPPDIPLEPPCEFSESTSARH